MSGKIHDISGGKGPRADVREEIERLEGALAEARKTAGGHRGEDTLTDLAEDLRETKRKKLEIEEEYDRASDRWRDERRRLNAEVDRLDRALQKSQSEARRSKRSDEGADEEIQTQLSEASALRQQAETALEHERTAWLGQKQELEARIGTLETNLVAAIERSNNQLRSEDAKEGALAAELETRTRALQEEVGREIEAVREQAAHHAKEWDSERGKLHLEIHRLKEQLSARAEDANPAPSASPAGKSSRFSLTGQLRARFGSKPAGEDPPHSEELEVLRRQLTALEQERDALSQRLTQAESSSGLPPNAEAEQRIRELEAQLAAKSAEFDHTPDVDETLLVEQKAWEAERSRLEGKIRTLEEGQRTDYERRKQELEDALIESQRRADQLSQQLETVTEKWAIERGNLEAEIAAASETGRTGKSASSKATSKLKAALIAAEQSRTQLETQLDTAREDWSAERDALGARLERFQAELEEAQKQAADLAGQREELEARLEQAEAREPSTESVAQSVQVATEEWAGQREALDAQIGELQSALEEARGRSAALETDHQALRTELDRARQSLASTEQDLKSASEDWIAERERLTTHIAQLEAAQGPLEAGQARVAKLHADLAAAEKSKNAVEKKFEAASMGWATDRDSLQRRIDELAGSEETATAAATELRAQYEQLEQGKTELERTLKAEASDLIAQRDRLEARVGDIETALEAARSTIDQAQTEQQKLEAQLDQALQARTALEAKLQTATAEWSQEREALAGRVSELQQALTEARRADADAGAHTQKLLSALEAAEQARDATETRLQAAAEDWTAERNALDATIGELKSTLAAAERTAGEAARTQQTLESRIETMETERAAREAAHTGEQEQLENRIRDVELGRSKAEDALKAAIEKSTSEIEHLNSRIAELETALREAERASAEAEKQRTELEVRMEETGQARRAIEATFDSASQTWSSEADALNSTIASLRAELETVGRTAEAARESEHALSRELEEARSTQSEMAASSKAASEEWAAEAEKLNRRIQDLEHALEQAEQAGRDAGTHHDQTQTALDEAQAAQAEVETRLRSLSAEWDADREALGTTIRELQKALAEIREGGKAADSDRQQIETQLDEARRSRDALEKRLQAASIEWDNERERLKTNLRQFQSALEKAQKESGHDPGDRSLLEEELKETKTALQTIEEKFSAASTEWSTQRDTLSNTVRDLKAALKKANEVKRAAAAKDPDKGTLGSFSKVLAWGRTRDRKRDGPLAVHTVAGLEARRQELEIRLDASEQARIELDDKYKREHKDWSQQRLELEKRIQGLEKAREEATSDAKNELEALRSDLGSKLEIAEAKLAQLQAESKKASDVWIEEREALLAQIAEWEQRMRTEIERVEAETRKTVSEAFQDQIRDLTARKEALEQTRTPAKDPSESGPSVEEEIARINAQIDEITRFIENPDSALSNVMRKNAERSELEAYRRGLSYLTGETANSER